MTFLSAAKRRWRWAVTLLVATAVGLAFAGQVGAAPADKGSAFTAVELANGLLFDDGLVAGRLAKLDRPPLERTDDMARAREAVDKAIESDPRWAKSFAGRFQSGDPRLIEAAIGDLTTLTRGVVDQMYGHEVVEKAIDEAGRQVGAGAAGKWIVAHTYVYVYKYAFFIRYFFVVWARDSLQNPAENPRLVDELTVRTIAENLSVRG
ncbi:MAG TPA: hypothetical protein VF755_23245 [Catenuloplanes sp.]|jgi:hypothetical protein